MMRYLIASDTFPCIFEYNIFLLEKAFMRNRIKKINYSHNINKS